jgi:hypothetical protein
MKYLYLMLLVVSLLTICCGCETSSSTTAPAIEAKPVSVSEYMTEVDRALDFIEDTLAIASQATISLADDKITRQEFGDMAVAGKANLENAEGTIKGMIPPSESSGPASFEDVHEYLLNAIDAYKRAFDEMIRYGDDGILSHVREATNLIENHGHPYINVVESELRILKKEFP